MRVLNPNIARAVLWMAVSLLGAGLGAEGSFHFTNSTDKSLALFERGVELSRFCHDQLAAAERRIEVLTERGELTPAPHLADNGDDR